MSNDKPRITAEQVINAYQETGKRPRTHLFFGNDNCSACAIGVLYYQEHGGFDGSILKVVDWSKERYGQPYQAGFLVGFDKDYTDTPYSFCSFFEGEEQKEFARGFEDGKEVKAAVFDER